MQSRNTGSALALVVACNNVLIGKSIQRFAHCMIVGTFTWRVREFPDCPFERYADDALIHCKSQACARQVLAALEQRMREAGLELHPDKTRIVYCKASSRRQPEDGPVSFDFLGYTFRPRDSMGKNGRFTGFDPAASPKAVKRMSQIVSGWRLHRLVNLTWAQLAGWIGPVIRGWMAYYGRFRHSELHPLLARINYHVQKWIRAKYRRLQPLKAMKRAWNRITVQMLPWEYRCSRSGDHPGLL
jgi:RNA-directed DNA polymerase